MIYEYKPSFDRSFTALSVRDQQRANQATKALVDFFATGEKAAGLGLKKLHHPFWEVRAGLAIRVLFALEGDVASFLLVGNHEDVRRFLKRAR